MGRPRATGRPDMGPSGHRPDGGASRNEVDQTTAFHDLNEIDADAGVASEIFLRFAQVCL
jgi:hypothetical protein